MAKVYSQLTKLSLVSSFGNNSSKPIRKAVHFIVGASVAALAGGFLLARAMQGSTLATGMPKPVIVALLTAIVFALTGFILMPMIHISNNQQFSLNKKLSVFPLQRKARWYVVALPLFIIAGMISLLAGPILLAISKVMTVNLTFVVLAYILGITTSICYVATVLPRKVVIKDLLFVAMCAGQMYLLEAALRVENRLGSGLVLAVIFVISAICYGNAIHSYFRGSKAYEPIGRSAVRLKLPKKVLYNTWFSLKLFRNRKVIASFCFCVIVSASMAIFNYVKHDTFIDPNLLIVIDAVLVCSFAIDLRVIVKRYKPPEIFDLLGVNYFVNSEVKSLLLAVVAIIAPIIPIVVLRAEHGLADTLVYMISLAIAAGFLGLMYGTILMPESGEVGTQFFTGIAAIVSLLALPKVLKFSSQGTLAKSVIWLCISGMCFLVIMIVEELRKKGYGHVE